MSKIYVTIQGDMWDSIARSQLGSDKYKGDLMTANTDYRNIYIFPAGIKLLIPDVTTVSNIDTLPPWKKASTK